ncbi:MULTISPECIES: glycoside hydrolase family 1 protein [Erysipelotrichaceae]|uniref:glycoside hydrolase family 1 protein n=1 Tax=Erysipelotrichaceae TaxID=128827 RepID=UPI000E3EFCFF|nr:MULTISPECIES: glycoside hydrolase family 1 protein [unclassified Absiella]RGB69183.1 glycoside hydrolase family 1 protein [Absiella sp. AM09-45]RGB79165.1 glycoside hydrolase family 1 protein [Absiella sp. AM09-50]RHU07796.1 glycoside hydrolase family 1 protein [Absiella sp. AM27-20]
MVKIETIQTFPDDFLWGASTSAFQVEGANTEDGKGLSTQDVRPVPAGLSDASIAADHYHRYKEDIALMKEAGLKSYRFSIAWTRIYPNGDDEQPNPKGIQFYSDLIDELIKNDITPIATLWHFDLPNHLEEAYHGWLGKETIHHFERYARTVFEAYGDRVKYWISINEQMMMVMNTEMLLGKGKKISYKEGLKYNMQACVNMSLAEKKAFQLCHEIIPDAKIGPSSAYQLCYPLTCDAMDVQAAMDAEEFLSYLVLDLSVRGEFPATLKAYLKQEQAYPVISEEEQRLLKKERPDFIGVNYYASLTVRKPGDPDPKADLFFFNTENYTIVNNPIIKTTTWLRGSYDPLGFKLALRKLYDRYQLPLMITENGYPQTEEPVNGIINDTERITYLKDHLHAIKETISEGIPVIGYHLWSFIDLLSGSQGYKKRYGLVYIDHQEGNKGTLQRIKKQSFYWYQKQIKEKGREI